MECFAQRLANPFRGTLQVIRHASAEAVSLDGVHWDIYVANDSLLEGLPANAATQVSDIRYGAWSAESGLKRGPLYPSEDFRRMEAMGALVYAHLLKVHDAVPFTPRDVYECWLLDPDGMPLALLQSATEEDATRQLPEPDWTPGIAAEEDFRPAGHDGKEGARRLRATLRALAGPIPRAGWFLRAADGSGRPLSPGRERDLPARAFPPLLLRAEGHAPAESTLIEAFLAWQSPWLLCLPGLDPATRLRLEGEARQRPDLVEALHRLYPEIIEPALINAARVEARLSRSRSAQAHAQDAQSTFYIELSPQGGGYT